MSERMPHHSAPMKIVKAALGLLHRLQAPATVVYEHAKALYDELSDRGWREMVVDQVDPERAPEGRSSKQHEVA